MSDLNRNTKTIILRLAPWLREAAQDLILFGTILFCLVFLISFPSHELSKMTFNQKAPESIPSSVPSGRLFVIEGLPNSYELRVNNRRLTPLYENVNFLGAVGISQRNFVTLTGFYKTRNREKANWFQRFLFVQEVSGFSKKIEVSPKLEIKKASNLRLPSSVWNKLDNAEEKRKKFERRLMRDVLNNFTHLKEFNCWYPPLQSKTTSVFGKARILPNGRHYFHSGLDLRARNNTPIRSMGDGVVVISDKMIFSGGTIVIDHGGGLFSRYFHMNDIEVEEGTHILRGQQIGLSGSTGRVNGPHLHWEVIWKGLAVDPLEAINEWKKICG